MSKAFWIGLECGAATHITIAINHMATPDDEASMLEDLELVVRPLLPMLFVKGAFKLRGYKGDVPTFSVSPTDGEVDKALKALYRKHYKQVPEHTAYPSLVYHVTVDTPEKRAEYDQLQDVFQITTASMKEVGKRETIRQVKA
jgi:hypothetical protein